MERLSPDDTRILRLESDVIAGHTMKLAIVEPAPDGRPLSIEDLRTRVESRLEAQPRARQRLAPIPLNAATPAWVDDEAFDIRRHVRLASERVADRAALYGFAGKAMAERLDHTQPLWCIDLAGPIEERRTGLVIRVHHCMADGVTALRMLSSLLWDGDDGAEPGTPRPWEPREPPGRMRLLSSGVASHARALGGKLSGAGRAIASPARWRESGRELAALPGALRRELWPLGADTTFDRKIGGDREIAFTACQLEELKWIEHSAGEGVTVNDVVLAVVAGAIRRWLGTRDELIHGMRVQVPVSMHHRSEDPEDLGNRDSFLFCNLPISEHDPRARLEAINAETRSRKEHHDPDELYSFFHSLSHIRPPTSSSPDSPPARGSSPSRCRTCRARGSR